MAQSSKKSKPLLPALIIVVIVTAAVASAIWLQSPPEDLVRKTKVKQEDPQPTQSLKRPDPPSQGYVTSQACAKCHPEIFKSYQTHPMAHSTAIASKASPLEDYEKNSFRNPGNKQYRVTRTSEEVFHHEKMTDSSGQTIYDQSVPVHYAVGSGKRGRTYLTNRDGLFFESPITWYSGRSCWDLSPGYSALNHQRFGRRITDGCIACHVGHVSKGNKNKDRYLQPPFLEHSIGCENCHGPGKKHIEFRNLADAAVGKDPIVNPARLDSSRRDAVCNQCHLHGEKRILRFGRTHFDFRPGDHLDDIWTVFVKGTGILKDGSTTAVSQVEQMHSSDCFQKSKGKLGCTSCHDPHRSPSPSERVVFYRNKCQACHGKNKSTTCSVPLSTREKPTIANSCIQCHMPRLTASDVPHTSQTDHRILRKSKSPSSVSTKPSRPIHLFDNAEKRLSAIEIARARGLLLVGIAETNSSTIQATRALKLLLPVLKARDDDLAVLEAVGRSYRIQGLNSEAKKHWETALKIDPKCEKVLEHMAVLCHESGENQLGVEYLDRFFAINSGKASLYGRHAHLLGKLKEFKRGINSANHALKLNPSLSQIHTWLAEAYLHLGDKQKSLYHRNFGKKLGVLPTSKRNHP